VCRWSGGTSETAACSGRTARESLAYKDVNRPSHPRAGEPPRLVFLNFNVDLVPNSGAKSSAKIHLAQALQR
jgi:hypothetical protein